MSNRIEDLHWCFITFVYFQDLRNLESKNIKKALCFIFFIAVGPRVELLKLADKVHQSGCMSLVFTSSAVGIVAVAFAVGPSDTNGFGSVGRWLSCCGLFVVCMVHTMFNTFTFGRSTNPMFQRVAGATFCQLQLLRYQFLFQITANLIEDDGNM